ncbi:hypothetical protein DEU56DRAFT_700395, partial [Suillus clintonianus]|uniref:uncharacterized protein n=1 Tax=Suillus clintonianus TaxID=1904413 RepID=UPI001B87401B
YATSCIVEFPHSKLQLPDLPPKHFPISSVSWSFATLLTSESGEQYSHRITRKQLPIQPAFAVTGQSAQGKTLPNIIVNLKEGGFAAYVAASRARTREGLFIIHPVKLKDLNKILPDALLREDKRLQILQHNTMVDF